MGFWRPNPTNKIVFNVFRMDNLGNIVLFGSRSLPTYLCGTQRYVMPPASSSSHFSALSLVFLCLFSRCPDDSCPACLQKQIKAHLLWMESVRGMENRPRNTQMLTSWTFVAGFCTCCFSGSLCVSTILTRLQLSAFTVQPPDDGT